MAFGALFALIWLAWPYASVTGGNVFVPLLALAGLAGLPAFARSRAWRHPAAAGPGAFLLWMGLSVLWSPVPARLASGSLGGGDFAVEATWVRLGLSLLAGAVACTALWRGRIALSGRLAGLAAGAVAVQAAGLAGLAWFWGDILAGTGPGWLPSPQSAGRDANLFALVLPVVIALAAIRLPARPAILVAAGLCLLAGLFAFAFEGLAVFLGLAAGAACAGFLAARPDKGLRRLFEGLGAAVLAAPPAFWLLARVLGEAGTMMPLSTQHRVHIWQATLGKIAAKPFAGHGLDASGTWQDAYASRPDMLERMPEGFAAVKLVPGHPHNMALQVWAELGLVGAGLLALAFVLAGRALPPARSLALPVRIAAGGVFGVAVVLFFFSYSAWDETFWASLAIVFCALAGLHIATKPAG